MIYPCEEEGSPDSEIHGEEAHKAHLTVLQELKYFFVTRRMMHTYAFEHYSWRYYLLMVPSIIISAAIAALTATLQDPTIVVTVLASVNTCLISILQLLEYQTLKSDHLKAAKMYERLNEVRLTVENNLYISHSRGEEETRRADLVDNLMSDMATKMAEISPLLPPVPDWIRDRADNKLDEKIDKEDTRKKKAEEKHGPKIKLPRRPEEMNEIEMLKARVEGRNKATFRQTG